MTLNEYIACLEELRAQEGGELVVKKYMGTGVRDCPVPIIRHMKVLNKREQREDYWHEWMKNDKGPKVVAV